MTKFAHLKKKIKQSHRQTHASGWKSHLKKLSDNFLKSSVKNLQEAKTLKTNLKKEGEKKNNSELQKRVMALEAPLSIQKKIHTLAYLHWQKNVKNN